MKILVVDDEDMQRDMLGGFLKKQGYEVHTAGDGESALALFENLPFQLVLLDQKMPGMSGEEVLEKIKAKDPLVRVIMITAFGSVETAVTTMKLGADEFLEKPVDLTLLLEKIEAIEQQSAIAKEAGEVQETMDVKNLPVRIIGNSPAMKDVLSMALRVAPTPWAVLIRGETGVGKELAARLVHLLSPLNDGPFVVINCGAIPENLFESELFGHEKGAFTGAASTRKGRFELAGGGSIFLDEIGELPLHLQPKLLRALQEKKISRVGSEREIDIDVRILAATNRDLRQMVDDGRFREDLYFRLNVFEIEIPPLRDRRDDIPALVEFFLERYAVRNIRFHPEALAVLVKYAFPGNIRELEHIVQRTVTLTRGSVIHEKDLPPEVRRLGASSRGTLSEKLDSLEKDLILEALEQHGWVQTAAAAQLGISERVLRYRMKKLNIRK